MDDIYGWRLHVFSGFTLRFDVFDNNVYLWQRLQLEFTLMLVHENVSRRLLVHCGRCFDVNLGIQLMSYPTVKLHVRCACFWFQVGT